MLGVPVIACDVGGLSTLIKHQETGILVPSNGVFEIVHYLSQLAADSELGSSLGAKAKATAEQRHEQRTIMKQLIFAYSDIKRGN